MTTLTPDLVALAHAYGVATDYHDWQGQPRAVTADTLVQVLGALGVPAGTPDEQAWSLETARNRDWRRVLPPVVVGRQGQSARVLVHVPHGTPITAWAELEDGSRRDIPQVEHWVAPRHVDGVLIGEAALEVPEQLPLGWHTLVVGAGGDEARTTLVMTPQRLHLPVGLSYDGAQWWGLMTQIYQVRSVDSWGIGDFGDMADLGVWGAGLGADFTLVNPLHAAEPGEGMQPSPYLPTSRRFLNPIYLRVEDVPEVAYLSSAERQLLEWRHDDARRTNTDDDVDRDLVWEHKRAALWIAFQRERSLRRQLAFSSFVAAGGQALQDFALWNTLAREHGQNWRTWPQGLQHPGSPECEQARAEHAEEIEFECWLQWNCREQLAATQRDMLSAGMRMGLMQDLAVGVNPQGADAWALQDVLARGASVGAPPDAYNQLGQNWGQPPWHPVKLAEAAYLPYRDVLRAALTDAGALRIDHILGLFRLWWIPEGNGAGEGTYVRYDHEAMVGILALEAQRAGAVVIGEDLGTVEPHVREVLADRGVLGTSILWFERDQAGAPLPPEQYRELCLATVTTHDLPPTAGYLEGVHLELRDRLGLFTRPAEVEWDEDEAMREQYLSMCRQRGLLAADNDGVDPDGAVTIADEVVGLHRLLAQTPSRLLGVALADLVGDRRIINQPGTYDEYPNWELPLADAEGKVLLLEQLTSLDFARVLARAVDR